MLWWITQNISQKQPYGHNCLLVKPYILIQTTLQNKIEQIGLVVDRENREYLQALSSLLVHGSSSYSIRPQGSLEREIRHNKVGYQAKT